MTDPLTEKWGCMSNVCLDGCNNTEGTAYELNEPLRSFHCRTDTRCTFSCATSDPSPPPYSYRRTLWEWVSERNVPKSQEPDWARFTPLIKHNITNSVRIETGTFEREIVNKNLIKLYCLIALGSPRTNTFHIFVKNFLVHVSCPSYSSSVWHEHALLIHPLMNL